jgi:hypothetical protein
VAEAVQEAVIAAAVGEAAVAAVAAAQAAAALHGDFKVTKNSEIVIIPEDADY